MSHVAPNQVLYMPLDYLDNPYYTIQGTSSLTTIESYRLSWNETIDMCDLEVNLSPHIVA